MRYRKENIKHFDLERQMHERRITPNQLARRTGLSFTQIKRYLADKNIAREVNYKKIIKALKI